MDELDTIKTRAVALITQSGNDPGALERGAQLLRTAEEIEKHRAEAQKLRSEASGISVLDYVKVLAPWGTVLAAVLAIVVQSSQNRTAQANATWERTVSSVSNDTASVIDVVELEKFLNTPEHEKDARYAAITFLGSGPASEDAFRLLFDNLYTDDVLEKHVGLNDPDDVLKVDRDLIVNYNAATKTHPRIPKREDAMLHELAYITAKIAPVLKNRKPDTALDLQNVMAVDGDFSNVDLSGAKLYGFDPERMDMSGAILNADDSQDYAGKWIHTAWWEARSINRDFLKNLEDKACFKTDIYYGKHSHATQPEYRQQTLRLGIPDTHTCNWKPPAPQ